jgi:hypothetical protein
MEVDHGTGRSNVGMNGKLWSIENCLCRREDLMWRIHPPERSLQLDIADDNKLGRVSAGTATETTKE